MLNPTAQAVFVLGLALAQAGATAGEAATPLPGRNESGRGADATSAAVIFRDTFAGGLGEGWSIEREVRTHWRTGPLGLEVRVQPGNMWGGANNARNVLVHAVPAPTDAPVEISITVSNRPTARWEQANLVWYYDGGHMVKLGQELVSGRLTVVMGREEADRARTVAIVPLDAYTVELRLQATPRRVRGQFRTAAWRDWREVGECDLPVRGEPKVSLQFYNGPAEETHWVRVHHLTVRRLSAASVDWPRERLQEQGCHAAQDPRRTSARLDLPDDFCLSTSVQGLAAEAKSDYDQNIYRHRDGSYGWNWHRRGSASKEPTFAGVGLGANPWASELTQGAFPPISLEALASLELELDAVTRLENDQGDHNLAAVIALQPVGKVSLWFDWYGPPAETEALNDGYRAYACVPTPPGSDEIQYQYRVQGFQGAPPRVNLKAVLDDAVRRGLAGSSQVVGVWFGNQVWNGSHGSTLVTRLDLLVNGRRHASVPAAAR
jgi:regulation of enolase protein 1 (concanavalin A-like superfamily)